MTIRSEMGDLNCHLIKTHVRLNQQTRHVNQQGPTIKSLVHYQKHLNRYAVTLFYCKNSSQRALSQYIQEHCRCYFRKSALVFRSKRPIQEIFPFYIQNTTICHIHNHMQNKWRQNMSPPCLIDEWKGMFL